MGDLPVNGDPAFVAALSPHLKKRNALFSKPRYVDRPDNPDAPQMELHLKPGEKPVSQRPYAVPPKHRKVMEAWLDEHLKNGDIVPSFSEWSSSVFFVAKKGQDDLRLVVDYRAVNERLARDAFPLPRVEALLDQLHGSTFFT